MPGWIKMIRARIQPLLASLAVLVAAGSFTGCAAEASNTAPDVPPGGKVGGPAADFQGISNWINSEPLTLDGLLGLGTDAVRGGGRDTNAVRGGGRDTNVVRDAKVVLVDFWTYTCVNCIRTLPYLKDWHDKYADSGLVIVGVHTPEFEFERLAENVVAASESFGLEYPIAQDNDFATWTAYSNRAWPAKYLVDKDGVVRFKHIGEGKYTETEFRIRQLLEDAGADLSGIELEVTPDPQLDPAARDWKSRNLLTRELYGGYNRNYSSFGLYVGQPKYYEGPDQVLEYTDPGDHANGSLYLHGLWHNGQEELRHARQTENYEDYIALKFSGTSANAVVSPQGMEAETGHGRDGKEAFEVQVTLDGRPLRPEEAGPDIVIEDGRSFFRVDEGRLYEVVSLPEYGTHELKLSSNSKDFALFAFTFGAYEEGP